MFRSKLRYYTVDSKETEWKGFGGINIYRKKYNHTVSDTVRIFI